MSEHTTTDQTPTPDETARAFQMGVTDVLNRRALRHTRDVHPHRAPGTPAAESLLDCYREGVASARPSSLPLRERLTDVPTTDDGATVAADVPTADPDDQDDHHVTPPADLEDARITVRAAYNVLADTTGHEPVRRVMHALGSLADRLDAACAEPEPTAAERAHAYAVGRKVTTDGTNAAHADQIAPGRPIDGDAFRSLIYDFRRGAADEKGAAAPAEPTDTEAAEPAPSLDYVLMDNAAKARVIAEGLLARAREDRPATAALIGAARDIATALEAARVTGPACEDPCCVPPCSEADRFGYETPAEPEPDAPGVDLIGVALAMLPARVVLAALPLLNAALDLIDAVAGPDHAEPAEAEAPVTASEWADDLSNALDDLMTVLDGERPNWEGLRAAKAHAADLIDGWDEAREDLADAELDATTPA